MKLGKSQLGRRTQPFLLQTEPFGNSVASPVSASLGPPAVILCWKKECLVDAPRFLSLLKESFKNRGRQRHRKKETTLLRQQELIKFTGITEEEII